MEHRIAPHRHEFLAQRQVFRIYPYRVSDDAERVVVGLSSLFTYVMRRGAPYRIRNIRITNLTYSLAEPTPPSEEVALANRQLHILLGIVVENALVLMYLLHTVRAKRITGSTGRVNKVLVVRILVQTRLQNRETDIDESHLHLCIGLIIHHHDGRDIDICRTRRTDSALGTRYLNCVRSFSGDTAPTRSISVFIYQSYLGIIINIQMQRARRIGSLPIYYRHRAIFHIKHVYSRAALRMKHEGKGFRSGDRIREGMVIYIAIHIAYNRIEGSSVVGLTDQRDLEFRIVHGLETAPFFFEAIFRCAGLQTELDMQRIDYIDVLTAYLHIRRTGCCARGGDGRGERRRVKRIAQAADSRAWVGSAVKRTRVGDTGNRVVRQPLPLGTNQAVHPRLFHAAEIGRRVIDKHRVFLVGLIARLDADRHVGVVTEDDGIATWVSAVVKQAILLLQIAPREDGSIVFAIHQFQVRTATAFHRELQPFIGIVLQLHLLLFIGISVRIDMHIMAGKERRIVRTDIRRSALDLEIAIYAVLRLERQLIRVLGIIPEVPRGDILGIVVRRILRTLLQGNRGSFLIEAAVTRRIFAEDQSAGAGHEIIALGTARY